MAAKKEWNLSYVNGAITNDVNVQKAEGKNAMMRYKPYVVAFAKASEKQREEMLQVGYAEAILNAARNRYVAYLIKEERDPNAEKRVAKVSATRGSELRTLMTFGKYACHNTVLNYFTDAMMNFDDVLNVAKFVMRKPVKGKVQRGPIKDWMPQDRKAPSKKECQDAIKVRKSSRRGSNGKMVRVATKAVDTMEPFLTGFETWFNQNAATKRFKAKAVDRINAIKRQLLLLQGIAADAVKAMNA